MKNDKLQPARQAKNNGLVYEVVRPQRKKLSRYKLKKQAVIIEQIIKDPQIMEV
jgi:hypothetical protein